MKEKVPNRQTLTAWCNEVDVAQSLGLRTALVSQVLVKCLSLFSLIVGFYFFSHIAHSWVVNKAPAMQSDVVGLALSLGLSWVLQGVFNRLSVNAKAAVLFKLEQQLHRVFAHRQHALVRQHSVYYWQMLWQDHIKAFTNWALEYRIQQMTAVCVPLFSLIVIFYIYPVIGFGLLLTLPVVPLFMIIVGKGAASLHQKHFMALERLGSIFTDRLNALSMLTSFHAHQKQTELLASASDNLNARTMKVVSVAFLSNSVLDFFATLAVALVAVFIGFTLLGELNIGPVITLQQGLWVLLTVPLLLSEMKKLGQVYHQKAQAQAAKDALAPVFSSASPNLYKPTTSDVNPALDTSHTSNKCTARINTTKNASTGEEQTPDNSQINDAFSEFEGLSATEFHVYEHNRDLTEPDEQSSGLLSASELTINAGDHILLSGRSGAGKTLLLEALGGQRPASHTLNARAIWLTQHPVITPGSVRDNLCLNDSYDDGELKHIIALVELEPWLKQLPYGLDTVMTDYPLLSGGEAQRLSLARALLRKESVWLLDEPTAHLSDEQHHRLALLIYRLSEDKTVIWASHKVLPAGWFNRFWHVENGEVNTKEVTS